MRQLLHAELNLHIAALGNFMGIFQSFRRIGEKFCHFRLCFQKILTAFIAHAVLIGHLFPCLDAEQNIMGRRIFFKNIMYIIGADQINAGFFVKPHQLLVDQLLLLNAMILKFQKEIALSEYLFISERCRFCLIIILNRQVTGHFPRQTGAQGNDSLMIFFQCFIIHTRLIVISFRKAR